MFLIAASPPLAYALSGCRRSCRGGPPAFLDAGAAAAGRLCRRIPDPTLGVVSGRRGLDEGLSPTVAAAGRRRLPQAREPANPSASPAPPAPRLLVALLGCGESPRACGRARPALVSHGVRAGRTDWGGVRSAPGPRRRRLAHDARSGQHGQESGTRRLGIAFATGRRLYRFSGRRSPATAATPSLSSLTRPAVRAGATLRRFP